MTAEVERLEAASRWRLSGAAKLDSATTGDASSPHPLVAAALLALCYYGGVYVGFAVTAAHSAVSLLWPTNAMVLAALLLSPTRIWPLLVAAVFPAHLLAEMSVDVPLAMVLCWYVSNMCEALIGAWCIRRWLGCAPRFRSFREFVIFLLCGVVLAPFLSSFLDAGFVAAVGWRYESYWTIWRTRFLSNVLATLTLVPLIVVWLQQGTKPVRRATLKGLAEASVLFVGLACSCALVFLQDHADPQGVMLLYLPLPFLIWAAMRLDMSGVSAAIAIVAAFAITGVLQERGPFAVGDVETNAQSVQVFLIIAATSLMLQSVSLAELRQARHAAVRQGERLQLALSAARMGTWDWDVGSDRISWSTTAADDDEPRQQSPVAEVLNSIHPDDRSRVSDGVAQAIADKSHVDVEFRWVDSALTRWIVAKGKLDSQGSVQRILGVHMDVTERKTQDLELHAQRDQLAHLSRVAVLGELSGALAHELNQPLTAIMTNAQAAYRELKARHCDMSVVAEILADIIAEDKRAGEVIRRLRALFRKDAVEMREMSMNECVRDVLALGHSDLIARRVKLDLHLAINLCPARVDRVQMQQVLLNLILNACDAMRDSEPGDRRLRIATRNTNEDSIVIEVTDRGSGIVDVDSIFQPFFTTKDHGLGLGLPICQTIVRAHQGRLWATNNPDRGATFHVALPVSGCQPPVHELHS
ncbi:MAG: MASE1 domain-containing protein [Steroidobacteraceae bacterium]